MVRLPDKSLADVVEWTRRRDPREKFKKMNCKITIADVFPDPPRRNTQIIRDLEQERADAQAMMASMSVNRKAPSATPQNGQRTKRKRK